MLELLGEDGVDAGYTTSAQTMYNLSRDWYRGRMDESWEPPTAEETEAIFAKHGLTGPFWKLS